MLKQQGINVDFALIDFALIFTDRHPIDRALENHDRILSSIQQVELQISIQKSALKNWSLN
jgi:hypothetical protein